MNSSACWCGEFECRNCYDKRCARLEASWKAYEEEVNNAVSVLEVYHVPVERLHLRDPSKTGSRRDVNTDCDTYVHVLDVLELIKALA